MDESTATALSGGAPLPGDAPTESRARLAKLRWLWFSVPELTTTGAPPSTWAAVVPLLARLPHCPPRLADPSGALGVENAAGSGFLRLLVDTLADRCCRATATRSTISQGAGGPTPTPSTPKTAHPSSARQNPASAAIDLAGAAATAQRYKYLAQVVHTTCQAYGSAAALESGRLPPVETLLEPLQLPKPLPSDLLGGQNAGLSIVAAEAAAYGALLLGHRLAAPFDVVKRLAAGASQCLLHGAEQWTSAQAVFVAGLALLDTETMIHKSADSAAAASVTDLPSESQAAPTFAMAAEAVVDGDAALPEGDTPRGEEDRGSKTNSARRAPSEDAVSSTSRNCRPVLALEDAAVSMLSDSAPTDSKPPSTPTTTTTACPVVALSPSPRAGAGPSGAPAAASALLGPTPSGVEFPMRVPNTPNCQAAAIVAATTLSFRVSRLRVPLPQTAVWLYQALRHAVGLLETNIAALAGFNASSAGHSFSTSTVPPASSAGNGNGVQSPTTLQGSASALLLSSPVGQIASPFGLLSGATGGAGGRDAATKPTPRPDRVAAEVAAATVCSCAVALTCLIKRRGKSRLASGEALKPVTHPAPKCADAVNLHDAIAYCALSAATLLAEPSGASRAARCPTWSTDELLDAPAALVHLAAACFEFLISRHLPVSADTQRQLAAFLSILTRCSGLGAEPQEGSSTKSERHRVALMITLRCVGLLVSRGGGRAGGGSDDAMLPVVLCSDLLAIRRQLELVVGGHAGDPALASVAETALAITNTAPEVWALAQQRRQAAAGSGAKGKMKAPDSSDGDNELLPSLLGSLPFGGVAADEGAFSTAVPQFHLDQGTWALRIVMAAFSNAIVGGVSGSLGGFPASGYSAGLTSSVFVTGGRSAAPSAAGNPSGGLGSSGGSPSGTTTTSSAESQRRAAAKAAAAVGAPFATNPKWRRARLIPPAALTRVAKVAPPGDEATPRARTYPALGHYACGPPAWIVDDSTDEVTLFRHAASAGSVPHGETSYSDVGLPDFITCKSRGVAPAPVTKPHLHLAPLPVDD